ncbi:MAG: DEAD/DEAH box helicase [Candidatus Promineifilaceae bacterium]
MPFKIPKTPAISTESPEALFRDLRTRKVPGLLAHQADILREYTQNAMSEPDVAFELPTGSGKTLVGLLLGEWRRRRFEERGVYLCPTNQLVHQVVDQAINKYGIQVTAFTGSKSDYSPIAKSQYLNGETMAVTSYSALFNVNPFFENPGFIVLDDVHSAENYIASYWSLKIERYDDQHKALFAALISALKNVLAPTDYQKLTGDDSSSWDITWVDKIATPDIESLIPEIVSIIDAHVPSTNLRFSWSILRDHLHACHFYIGTYAILVRPLLPPTNTHAPFANADQRVYMSATLGEGGELERLTGRKGIARLQVPPGWDKQGIGRRLFFFPGHSFDEDQSSKLILDMIQRAGRSLIIVPDNRRAEDVRELVDDLADFEVFNVQQIETSKAPFVQADKAVAIIANRYDGIDFIDDECRLLIVGGLPRATNLQERFIISKMGAVALLNDRIMTRTVQAFGRCTRSATDYAAVVVWDEELHKYLLIRERRKFLHPELQAELEFGIEQAKEASSDDFLEFLKIFLAQDAEWIEADNYIASQREDMTRKSLPGTADLKSAVSYEVDYQYAMWEGDYVRALDNCRSVLTHLNDPDLRGYRALWNYLAGGAAWLSYRNGMSTDKSATKAYFSNAQKAAPAIRWLVRLSRTMDAPPGGLDRDSGSRGLALVERLEAVLEKLGTFHDRKFAKAEKFVLENLASGNSVQFEQGHEKLGELLGFDAGNVETSGAPDPWWIVDDELCFIFEDHSDASPDSNLHLDKARQIATHPNWVRKNLHLSESARIVPVLITPVQFADSDALPHLGSVFVWHLDEFCAWAKKALSVVRELRSVFPGSGDLAWRATAIEKYRENDIEPEKLIEFLEAQPSLTARK